EQAEPEISITGNGSRQEKNDLVTLYMMRLLEIMYRFLSVCMSIYRSGSGLEKQEKRINTSDLMHNPREEED
ncbi:MAG TPA: hypothetical protein H9713_06380, partial [Candidatus Mediterraneibacter surreyensis]|nr:hypothetical protein [Candidatus Mediterraneibacter surreyensis]